MTTEPEPERKDMVPMKRVLQELAMRLPLIGPVVANQSLLRMRLSRVLVPN
jgi:hypothetical protein